MGGHRLPIAIRHDRTCSARIRSRPVVPVMDAVRVELDAIAFRDGPKVK